MFQKQPFLSIKNQGRRLVIRKVDADTFYGVLGLIDKLAQYEKLPPPDEEAKKRLWSDCISEKPKYEAIVEKIGDKCVLYALLLHLFELSCSINSLSRGYFCA